MRHCTQCGAPAPDDARFCPKCGTPVTAAPGGDAMLGKVIADRYLLVEKIGQGGSGTIYRGEHTTLRKKVAVKILHAQLSTDDTALERFRREATTVAELDNDHILQVLDFGRSEDQRLFFAMEYLEGETLTKVIERDKKLPVPRAVDILTQIAEALMEAHGLGYVHRDLRPRNVFLINRRGRADFVKLLDFGLAKLILPNAEAKQTAMGMTFGDPRYMSPEQARGDVLDRRSDIYSLGAIAFEMLSGSPPYTGSGTFEILQQHMDAPVPKLRDRRPDCPEWLDLVVQRALSKQREGRFLTVLKMLECLRSQMAPPAADAAEKAAHAQLTAETPGKEGAAPASPTSKAAPNAPTMVGSAPVVLPAQAAAKPAQPQPAQPQSAQPQPAPLHSWPAQPMPSQPPASQSVQAAHPLIAHAPPASHEPLATAVTAPQTQVPAAGMSPQARALGAAIEQPASTAQPPAGNPRETQAITGLGKAGPATQPGNKSKKQKLPLPRPSAGPPPTPAVAAAPPPPAPVAAASGSMEVTPPHTRAPEPASNVPSVVVESSSQEKTVPEKLPASSEASFDERATTQHPLVAPTDKSKDRERPATGEWFSTETPMAAGASYDDEFDDLPRKNRAPMIIGGVAGGLILVGGIVIALLPKPEHKPLRGEAALNQPAPPASGASVQPAAPSGASAQPAPSSGVSAAPLAAAPSGTTPSGASAAPLAAAPSGASAAPSPAAPAPATGAPAAPAPKVAEKPPAPAAVVEKPVLAEKPAPRPEKPAVKTVERADKVERQPTRVASAERAAPAERPAPATDKHKAKGVPEGFKDPFGSDGGGAKASANESAQAEFFIKLGRQKLNADELAAAAANFNKAREYDARSSEAIAGLGEVAFEQGDYNGAAVHLKQALRLAPNRTRYLVLLGQTYYKMGKPKDAVDEYKKALRIDPSNQEARHSLEVAERKLNGGWLSTPSSRAFSNASQRRRLGGAM